MKSELDTLHTMLDSIQSYNTYGKLKSFKYTAEELKSAFNAYPYCESIDKLKLRADKFERLVGYLYTAQSYVVESEQPLYNDITNAIENLSKVIISDKDSDFKKYEALLNSLVDRYADYYINYYAKCRLSPGDFRIKEKIMGSESKHLCDIIKDSEFITATEYQNWINSHHFFKRCRSFIDEKPG